MSVAVDLTSTPPYHGFNSAMHLAISHEHPGVLKMQEIGYARTAESDIAVTKPFPLFTHEAVCRIRHEIFNHDTLAKHLYSDNNNPCVVRGVCPRPARFTYEAWTDPAVVKRLNDYAGVPITPVCDYEIGHTNVQLGPRGWAGLKAEPDLPCTAGQLATQKEIQPTVMTNPNWHKDSYPFVCILMLSESSHLQGGRTVICKADGSSLFCQMPPIGHAMILQGGHIEHAVSPTDTTQERIAMVTSFRFADPLVRDVCVLNTVRTMSDEATLHRQWCQYRLHVLGKRAESLGLRIKNGELCDSVEAEMRKFVEEQGKFLALTLGEMVNPVKRVRTNTRQTFLDWKADHGTARARL